MKRILNRLYVRSRKFIHREEGVSLVEFALILPIMLAFYMGTVEVSRGLSVSRNVTTAASTVADLISLQPEVSDLSLNNIFKAAELIISPHNKANMKIYVSYYCRDENNIIQKDWFQDYKNGTTQVTTGSSEVTSLISAPATTTALVVAEVEYQHQFITPAADILKLLSPSSTTFEGSGWTIKDRYFVVPRTQSGEVKNTDDVTKDCGWP